MTFGNFLGMSFGKSPYNRLDSYLDKIHCHNHLHRNHGIRENKNCHNRLRNEFRIGPYNYFRSVRSIVSYMCHCNFGNNPRFLFR